MYGDPSRLDPRQAYALMTSTIVPRPIAWITTTDGRGHVNIAPFSYFQALCSDPPMLTVTFTTPRDGGAKDTLRLLRETGWFVVHLVEAHDLERMNATSIELPPDQSEAEHVGIETVPWPSLPAVRITSSRIAWACKLVEEHRFGRTQTVDLVVGEIVGSFIDEALLDDSGAVVGDRIAPVARLGGSHYALLGERRTLARPPRPR